jgi:hypothetical protein
MYKANYNTWSMAPYSIKYTFQILVIQMVESDHNHQLVHELIILKTCCQILNVMKISCVYQDPPYYYCYQLKHFLYTIMNWTFNIIVFNFNQVQFSIRCNEMTSINNQQWLSIHVYLVDNWMHTLLLSLEEMVVF